MTLKTKGDEKEAVNNEEEELFWSKGLFGQSSASVTSKHCLFLVMESYSSVPSIVYHLSK